MDEIKKTFLQLNRQDQKAFIEALIFSSEEAMSSQAIYNSIITNENKLPIETVSDIQEDQITITEEMVKNSDFTLDSIQELINEINNELTETNRPYHLLNVGGGFTYAIRPEYGVLLHQIVKNRMKKRLSHAALETLAIIAYRQPVTKPEIDQIRGVNSIDIINSLTEKKFVEIVGRKDALGRPLLYGTTPDFLRIFGLNSLDELPKLRELEQVESQFLEQASEFEIVVNEENVDEVKDIEEPAIPTFDPNDTENIEFDDIDQENLI